VGFAVSIRYGSCGQLVPDGDDVVDERVHVGELGPRVDEAWPDREAAID